MSRVRLATALVLALVVSGCAAPPAGTDGHLANEWPAMAAPAVWAPQVGDCVDRQHEDQRLNTFEPIDCAQPHRFEIVHVGTAADVPEPPVRLSEPFAKAWSECDAKASEFLGGPWQERKLRLGVSFPYSAAWASGARWYMCMLNRYHRLNDGLSVKAAGSLKGRFTDPEVQFGCLQLKSGSEFEIKSCTAPHNVEFVGVFTWDGTWESLATETAKDGGEDHLACHRLVATFVGVVGIRTGTWVWTPSYDDFRAGDHVLRCHLYLGDTKVSTSMKGVGARGWPLK